MPPNRKASLFVGLAPYDNFILSKDRWYYNFYMYSRNLLDVFPCRVTNVHSQRVYRQFPYCANAEKNICTVWQNKMYQALVNTNVVQGSWPVIIGFVFGYVELLGLGILFMLFLSTPERVLLRWGYISTCHRSSFVYKTNITWYRHEISFVHPSYSRITKSSPWPLFMYFNNWSTNSTLADHRDGRYILVMKALTRLLIRNADSRLLCRMTGDLFMKIVDMTPTLLVTLDIRQERSMSVLVRGIRLELWPHTTQIMQ